MHFLDQMSLVRMAKKAAEEAHMNHILTILSTPIGKPLMIFAAITSFTFQMCIFLLFYKLVALDAMSAAAATFLVRIAIKLHALGKEAK
jgi:hypothetical protein